MVSQSTIPRAHSALCSNSDMQQSHVILTPLKATLAAIQESLPGLLFFNSVKRSRQPDDSQSEESLACLAYLLFVQLITMESFPAVFR